MDRKTSERLERPLERDERRLGRVTEATGAEERFERRRFNELLTLKMVRTTSATSYDVYSASDDELNGPDHSFETRPQPWRSR